MINLFENYDEKARDLEYSLEVANYDYKTVVLEDDGFLPLHVLSPTSFFTGMTSNNLNVNPLFFNEIQVPFYWEIKGDGTKAEIFDGYIKKGHIHYSSRKGDYRIVQAVDWYNPNGKVRLVEHYNQYGKCFKKSTYADGQLTLITYLDADQHEVIVHNQITGTVELSYKDKKYIFNHFNELILFYFDINEFSIDQIFYNNLGRPFFVTQVLKQKYPNAPYSHKLFWQESAPEIPGNMLAIITDSNCPTKQIVIQNREEYLKIKNQIKDQNIKTYVSVDYLGFIYPLKNSKKLNPDALILTNSDNIEKIKELVEVFPALHFNIAARTNMSTKLTYFSKFENVTLFPSVSNSELETLLQKNSFYLDINYGLEVENIIRTAFVNNLLILTFKETIHTREYISAEHIFEGQHFIDMVEFLLKLLLDEKEFHVALKHQLWDAGQSTIRDYQAVLEKE